MPNSPTCGVCGSDDEEIGDQSPEAVEALVRAAIRDMPEETMISIAAKILDIIEKRKG